MENKKLEAIKKAYGEHWELMENYIDSESGFVNHPNSKLGRLGYSPEDSQKFKDFSKIAKKEDWKMDQGYFRPKNLNGIHDNNGWTVINSVDDLPKEEGQYFVFTKGTNIKTHTIVGGLEMWEKIEWKEQYTHYQPINKPQPPIY